MVLAKSECGQICVNSMQSSVGSISGPPAESEYAEAPVGVENIRPSARRDETKAPSASTVKSFIL